LREYPNRNVKFFFHVRNRHTAFCKLWHMLHGAWYMVHSTWCIVHGSTEHSEPPQKYKKRCWRSVYYMITSSTFEHFHQEGGGTVDCGGK